MRKLVLMISLMVSVLTVFAQREVSKDYVYDAATGQVLRVVNTAEPVEERVIVTRSVREEAPVTVVVEEEQGPSVGEQVVTALATVGTVAAVVGLVGSLIDGGHHHHHHAKAAVHPSPTPTRKGYRSPRR